MGEKKTGLFFVVLTALGLISCLCPTASMAAPPVSTGPMRTATQMRCIGTPCITWTDRWGTAMTPVVPHTLAAGDSYIHYASTSGGTITEKALLSDQGTTTDFVRGVTSGVLAAVLYNVPCDIFTTFTSTPLTPPGMTSPTHELINCSSGFSSPEQWFLQPYNTTTPIVSSIQMDKL